MWVETYPIFFYGFLEFFNFARPLSRNLFEHENEMDDGRQSTCPAIDR